MKSVEGYCVDAVRWALYGNTLCSFLHYVPNRFDKWISNIVDSALSIENYPAVLCVGKHAQLSKHYRSRPLATWQVRTIEGRQWYWIEVFVKSALFRRGGEPLDPSNNPTSLLLVRREWGGRERSYMRPFPQQEAIMAVWRPRWRVGGCKQYTTCKRLQEFALLCCFCLRQLEPLESLVMLRIESHSLSRARHCRSLHHVPALAVYIPCFREKKSSSSFWASNHECLRAVTVFYF